uniref:Uncharacterized protein n=1 Tax=Brassica oleracea TaxID=3712 RepID=A0A3P6GH41_BRAOL|nr:unnamed protein product [Brassica oleracea]
MRGRGGGRGVGARFGGGVCGGGARRRLLRLMRRPWFGEGTVDRNKKSAGTETLRKGGTAKEVTERHGGGKKVRVLRVRRSRNKISDVAY